MEENSETISILYDNIECFSPLSLISCMIHNDISNAMLFTRYLHPSFKSTNSFSNFLTESIESINSKIPMTINNFHIRWNVLLIIGELTVNPHSSLLRNITDDYSLEMAKSDFANLKDQISKGINPYISAHNKITDKVATQLCLNLMKLKDQYPGIFYNLLPHLQILISNIRHDRIFRIIGHEILSLCIDPPFDLFGQLNGRYANEAQFHSIFSYPITFKSIEFTQFLQTTLIVEHFSYPIPFFGKVFNSLYSSLLNSSIEKKRHFIDLIGDLVNEAIITSDNNSVLSYTSVFPELVPYFLIQHQTQIYSDLDTYFELLEGKYPSSLAADIVTRFRNDYRLLQLLSMLAGVDFCSGELLVHSIPYHLQFVLNQADDILNASQHQYFSISDQDAEKDFDFVNGYTAIRIFLSAIQLTKSQNLVNLINLTNSYIKNIKNIVTKQMVILDIFSLIFVTNKNSFNLICNPYAAYLMIEKLVEYDVSDYIEGAYKHFLARKPHKSDQSITLWLNLDTSMIYNAIDNHNWEFAEKLTAYLPYFKRFYTRAFIAYQYQIEKKEPNQNLSIVKLDIALSSFCLCDLLKELKPIFPHYQALINFRIRNQTDTILEPINDTEKWIPINDFVLMFDQTPLEMVKRIPSFIETINLSKKLSGFLNYLYLYHLCAKCGDYFHAETIEDLFVFDFQRALAGPIKYGEYQKANQLCELSNIDLLTFIFENINSFDSFDNVFLEKIHEKYPLVSSALELTILFNNKRNLVSNEITIHDANVEKISNYYDSLSDEETDSLSKKDAINMINEFLETNDMNIIDDIIFKIDHNIIFNLLMTKYDNNQIFSKLFPIFDIVSYVSPADYNEKIEHIYHMHKIATYASKDIMTDLLNNDEFDLAILYLKNCVGSDSFENDLVTLISLCQNFPIKMDTIFTEFGNYYEIVFKHFSSNRLIIKTLVNYVPKDKKDYFIALTFLPEILLELSNAFDFNQIVDFYLNHISYLPDMTIEISGLFDDSYLLKLIEESYKQLILSNSSIITRNIQFDDLFALNANTSDKFDLFHSICTKLYKYFNQKNSLISFWISTVSKSLTNFHQIKTIRMEVLLEIFFRKIVKILKLFMSYEHINEENWELLNIIDAIRLISSFNPFSRFGRSLQFTSQSLNSIDFLNKIQKIAVFIEDDDFLLKIGSHLKIDINFYFLLKAKYQLLFGQFYEADLLLDGMKLKIDDYVKNVKTYDTQFQFLTPVNKLPFFNQNLLTAKIEIFRTNHLIDINSLDIFPFLLKENNEIQSNGQEFNQLKLQNNELLEERINQKKYSIIYNFCRTGPSISMLISFRQFEMAYQQLLQINDFDEQSELFVHSFLFSVQFNNVSELFKKFLYKSDPNLTETANLWVRAIHFFRTNGMPYNLLLCYTIRNQLEDAAMIGIDVFKKLTSYDMQVSLLGQIAICLDQSLIYRKQMKQVTPPFIPNNELSIKELENYKEKSELQLQISLMCVEQNTPFSHDFDLISSPEGAVSVAALLYLNHNSESVKSVMKLTGIEMKDVSNKISELLSKENPNKILDFWKNLRNHKNELGPDIPYSLLKHLDMSSNRSLIMTIILSFFTSQIDQCKLFLQYGCITEAFSLASQIPEFSDLIPIIGNRAALDGNIVIYDNCMKLLAK